MNQAFGFSSIAVGLVLAAMTLFIVFGGIQRVADVSAVLVPVMAVGYFLLAVYIVISNISILPHVLKVIVDNAFGISQVAGGGIGAVMVNGVKRGLFSNEAGEGSAPNAASTADVTHPVKQGLIQALGVFTDTLLICSCTAFIILISGLYQSPELNGINLTQAALQSEIGDAGPLFIAVAIFLFAFSSIIANYYYGESNIRFMTSSRTVMTVYRIFSGGVMVVFGALITLEFAWNIIDICMALLTACNLVAIIALGKYAFRLLDDYRSQQRKGVRNPQFNRRQLPEIADALDCWE
jgi:AGCS family alanine or glycine:cation symporter